MIINKKNRWVSVVLSAALSFALVCIPTTANPSPDFHATIAAVELPDAMLSSGRASHPSLNDEVTLFVQASKDLTSCKKAINRLYPDSKILTSYEKPFTGLAIRTTYIHFKAIENLDSVKAVRLTTKTGEALTNLKASPFAAKGNKNADKNTLAKSRQTDTEAPTLKNTQLKLHVSNQKYYLEGTIKDETRLDSVSVYADQDTQLYHKQYTSGKEHSFQVDISGKDVRTILVAAQDASGNEADYAIDVTRLGMKVNEPLKSFTLSAKNISLAAGQSADVRILNTDPFYFPWTANDVTYHTESDCIRLTKSGRNVAITALKAGQADITVSIGSIEKTCHVTVRDAADPSFTISNTDTTTKPSSELHEAGTSGHYQITAPEGTSFDQLELISSDTSAVTADLAADKHSFVLNYAEPGTSSILLKDTQSGQTLASFTVTVYQAVEQIYLDDTSRDISLPVGETYDMDAILKDASGNQINGKIHWESSDTDIVSIDQAGTITGKKLGSATITANTEYGLYDVTTVTVDPIPAESISISASRTTLNIGDKLPLSATVYPDDATYREVSWSSSNDQIATVSAKGIVTAKKAGKVTISARSKDDMAAASITLTISDNQKKTTKKEASTKASIKTTSATKEKSTSKGSTTQTKKAQKKTTGESKATTKQALKIITHAASFDPSPAASNILVIHADGTVSSTQDSKSSGSSSSLIVHSDGTVSTKVAAKTGDSDHLILFIAIFIAAGTIFVCRKVRE